MAKRAEPTRKERFERFIVRLIQFPGADQGHPRSIRILLSFLHKISYAFHGIVKLRAWAFENGFLAQFPLGCQVISVGNVTAGGTGKTPVVEIFARELTAAGRKVAILSRGYRKKERPLMQRLFGAEHFEPPRIVSDGKQVLLDSESSGDEPFMLASNLPGVVVLVDKDRVKSGRYAISRFGCDMLLLDDGFQYRRLKHTHEIVLVDSGNPFGNGHMLPRGILREPVKNIKRADFIFITKSDGNSKELRKQLAKLNPSAEIVECRHEPKYFKNAFSGERLEIAELNGMRIGTLSGIASPISFENSLRAMGAKIFFCERYTDHHRYTQQEILDVINRADDAGVQAIITTEKDAVRFQRLEHPKVPIFYMRMEIKIIAGYDNFRECVKRICFR